METGAILVAGFAEEDQGIIYNSAMMVAGDKLIGIYRKIHLFNREKLWFSPGNRQPLVYDVGGIRIGMMICFDWFFPETARTLAIKGAQVIAHPSNLVMPYCQGSMPTRCLENRVYAITANRIGRETRGPDNFLFTGASQVTAVNGDILSSAPIGDTYAAVVDFDNYLADNKMINDYNDILNDRKPDLYF
jgi:predicted amidohydrolase